MGTRWSSKLFMFSVMVLFSSFLFVACEPAIRLTIQNSTKINFNVLVYMGTPTSAPYEIGNLAVGESIKYVFEHDSWAGVGLVYVFALDADGYLEFYRKYTKVEVKQLGGEILITDEPTWHQTPYWSDLWPPPPWKTK